MAGEANMADNTNISPIRFRMDSFLILLGVSWLGLVFPGSPNHVRLVTSARLVKVVRLGDPGTLLWQSRAEGQVPPRDSR